MSIEKIQNVVKSAIAGNDVIVTESLRVSVSYDILAVLRDENVKHMQLLRATSRDCSYDRLANAEVIMFDDVSSHSSSLEVIKSVLENRSIDGRKLLNLKSVIVVLGARAEVSILGEIHKSAPTAEIVIF